MAVERNLSGIATSLSPYHQSYDTVTVDVDAVQDLNGYDEPWVGGAGKNLFTTLNRTEVTSGTYSNATARDFSAPYIYCGITATNYFKNSTMTSYSVSDDTIVLQSNQRPYGLGFTMDVEAETAYYLTFTCDGDGEVRIGYYDSSGNPLSASGARTASDTFTTPSSCAYVTLVFTCQASAVDTTLTYTQIQLEKGSTGTAWTPYENICPITGWTGANVTTCGKNLLDPSIFIDQAPWHQGTLWLFPNTTYTFSTNCDGTELFAYFAPTSSFSSSWILKNTHPVTLTTDSTGVVYYQQRRASGSDSFANYQWQCEAGSTATTYEAYNGHDYTYSFGQTVYGARLDALTGEATVTYGYVDLGDLTWTMPETGLFRTSISDLKAPTTGSERITGLQCSAYTTSSTSLNYMTDPSMIRYSSYFYIKDGRYSDATTFKSAMSGIQLVYELSTPTTISTSAQSITPQEYIWADTGDVTVEEGLTETGLSGVVTLVDPFV